MVNMSGANAVNNSNPPIYTSDSGTVDEVGDGDPAQGEAYQYFSADDEGNVAFSLPGGPKMVVTTTMMQDMELSYDEISSYQGISLLEYSSQYVYDGAIAATLEQLDINQYIVDNQPVFSSFTEFTTYLGVAASPEGDFSGLETWLSANEEASTVLSVTKEYCQFKLDSMDPDDPDRATYETALSAIGKLESGEKLSKEEVTALKGVAESCKALVEVYLSPQKASEQIIDTKNRFDDLMRKTAPQN
jgi:hypothetical protein